MRILLVHNFYNSAVPSGESHVLEAEEALLQSRGHQVFRFQRYSDDIQTGITGKLYTGMSVPWNVRSVKEFKRLVRLLEPDIIHVHNSFPLISPAIFRVKTDAPKVLTLHNYRIVCPAAIPMRENRVCTECIDRRSVLPALLHGCYRRSRMATIPLAASVAIHRQLGTWGSKVDAFIVLSDFQKQLMVSSGNLPAAKVYVKPNFYPGRPKIIPWLDRSDYVVFVGRLSEEKGVISLLKAWRIWGSEAPELRIVGDGPLREQLVQLAEGLPVRFLGQIKASAAQAQIAAAKLQILPSECFEGFPMVVREAFAFGTPSAVSRIGPLPSIVTHHENGIVFAPALPDSIFSEVSAVWRKPALLEKLGQNAREEYELKYTEESNYLSLMEIYNYARENSKK